MGAFKISMVEISSDPSAYEVLPTALAIRFEAEDDSLRNPGSVSSYYDEFESESDEHNYRYGYNIAEESQEFLSVFLTEYRRAYADNLSFFPEELNIFVTVDGTREMLFKDFLLSIKDDVLSGKY